MVGWEYNCDEQTSLGGDCMFNMILQDGTRSDNAFTYYSSVLQRYDYFLPQNKKITAVTINYGEVIIGFRFHLSDGSNWDIGYVDRYNVTVVDIAEHERIVGFKAKSLPNYPAQYTEFQFITARGLF